ncbi:hypothetical protein ZIOFF_055560 [Zingiber officinale]|uniref:Uncharacterized protein n=1 Tax=Zingiber officinale TaxID=94328 RepID=A0A8J5KQ25_ZINOF|nr:hypothetical protein ZIOFF_055560 [Zingiber officinale]
MTARLGVGLASVEEFEQVLRLCRYILDLQLRGRPREAPPGLAGRLPRRPDLGGVLKEVPGHLRPRAALPDLPRSPALRRGARREGPKPSQGKMVFCLGLLLRSIGRHFQVSLLKDRIIEVPPKQRMERQETLAKEHREEHKAASRRTVHRFSMSLHQRHMVHSMIKLVMQMIILLSHPPRAG